MYGEASCTRTCGAGKRADETLEAKRDNEFDIVAKAKEQFRLAQEKRALARAQAAEEQAKRDKEDGKAQDTTMWRALKEAAIDKTKKEKEEVRAEAELYKAIAKPIEKGEELLIAVRMAKIS